MKVYIVEYCDMLIGIYSTKAKALAYVRSEIENYLNNFKDVSREFLQHEKKDFSSRYEIYKEEVK